MKKVILFLILFMGTASMVYTQSVTIGSQEWTVENLNVDKFRNGDPIPQAKTAEDWVKAGKNGEPAWCYYDNDAANGEKYGKMYNWHAVSDPRGLAPEGWHIPSKEEWTLLIDYLGGDGAAGTKMKSTKRGQKKGGWLKKGNGTNESGFSGVPGGSRNSSGNFGDLGFWGKWWSSTQEDTNSAWGPALFSGPQVGSSFGDKGTGFSVRCLKD